jgi:uncharacterized circularly permuted ATP-grasp superfamily protein/uncharacterized alpha-E superfamily protein
MGAGELQQRANAARRMLRDHGVAYNAFGDLQGLDRPWELDLIPWLLSEAEWRTLEAGIRQRTRLLARLLEDLYGSRNLLAQGLIPPGLILPDPCFLRPACGGRRQPRFDFLLLAFDLARTADGSWRVLATHAEAPHGHGYALENRIVGSRFLPEEFRSAQVHRLAGFFQNQREALANLSPTATPAPNILVLTGSPRDPAYFEDAYLARYLGFPLVEAADLTARGGQIHLKTLVGLRPVHVVLRHLVSEACDPLELGGPATGGAAGLMDAHRQGTVKLANAPGSGIAGNPGLDPFLPALSPALLGEELQIPASPTWWCGLPDARNRILSELTRFIIRPATGRPREPVFPQRLTSEELAQLLRAIQARPHEFVAQEATLPSQAPVWTGQALEPQAVVLRVFALHSEGGVQILPGGLARASPDPHDLLSSSNGGGVSKDVWICSDQPVPAITLLKPLVNVVRLERIAAEVPSRVADNLFWLGRYAERLEDVTRILRCVLHRLAGEARYEKTPELGGLMRLMLQLELLPERLAHRPSLTGFERECLALVYQAHRLGTISEIVGRLQRIAFAVRDRFSADSWRILQQLQSDARQRPGRVPLADALNLLNTLVLNLAAFSGMEMENMTRGHGWRFLDLGRRLERAVNVVTLCQAGIKAHTEGEVILEPMLEIGDSIITYRRRYFAPPQLSAVLDLLLADETNPRSLAFQLQELLGHAARLPRTGNPDQPLDEQRQLERLQGALGALDFQGAVTGEGLADEPVARVLRDLAAELPTISDSFTHRYFSHAIPRIC